MTQQVEITEQMQSYIDTVLAEYVPVESLKEVPEIFTGRTILHLYPTHDTGEEGYCDGLFFTVKLYHCDSKRVWCIDGRDQVELNVDAPRVRVFKDGSTMLIIDRPVSIRIGQSLEVNGWSNGQRYAELPSDLRKLPTEAAQP